MTKQIALIGFGEAGFTFAQAGGWGSRATAFDIAPARRSVMEQVSVTVCQGLAEALSGASLVLSLVTADQALAVAREAAGLIDPQALFCDMNSVAPGTKREAAEALAAAGKRYVDVAVMAPVHPAALDVPLNISGEHAAEAEQLLAAAGFTKIKQVGDEIGRASTIKMLRSVMYKGMEALTAECVIACERAGVTDEVLGSFGSDWASGADYRFDRILVHGQRRAAELREVCRTLSDLGLEPRMSSGTVAWEQELGELGINPPPEGLKAKLAAIAATPAFSSSTKKEN
ncbi:phosphogluconate dehydrogenase NAD-binding protein [Novosphingobium sp. Rr 2-17]|uniref:NAD(P)-dependent oxidoreductase n=1 Tax=Novosphingobium sp. Rr 2-17 TaxID=555793 RepID=UPI000269A843|nr:NAD(P)-dependent oxidoreductase [Novosphingobium sp. Rr 2-17]EIZ78533.1 phosphogluconate dehydrogenase NAD-binding protein [Novosphingobium sp. Rr 2-17]